MIAESAVKGFGDSSRPDLAVVVKTLEINLNIVTYLDASLALSIYLQGLEVLGTDVDKVWSSRCEDPLPPGLQEALQGFLFGYESDEESTPAQSYIACAEILVLLLSLLPNVTTLVVDGAFIGMTLSPSAFRAFGINSIKLKRLYAGSLPRAIVDVAHDLDELIIGPRFEVRQEPKPRSISYCLSPEHELPEHGEENNPVPHALDRRYLEKSFAFYKGPVQSFRFETHGIKPDTRLPRPSFNFLNSFRTTLQSLHLDFHIDNTSGATIGSLKKFINLKDVFIASNLIYHNTTDVGLGQYALAMLLPENIERFTLFRRSTSEAANNNLNSAIALLAMTMGTGIFPEMTLVEFLCEDGTTRAGAKIYRLEGNKIKLEGGDYIPTRVYEIP
ncbi:hypothetical protein FMEXI_3451 [Fusarium mexicanum]|uniref:Uncharacterized protein n=1 Tax=Fusarium mexicanum TaxID=751941 RepID=A0A8H5N4C0_9HYPO|nr:hypothetical protein FMEXI_3451 [Fusarium mexicanum]